MARRSSAGSGALIGLVILASAVGAAYEWAKTNKDLLIVIGCILAGLFLLSLLSKYSAHRHRVTTLREKYQDEAIVRDILARRFWKGQTKEQLDDSLGEPHGHDKTVLKTKTKETWKYHEVQRGQFALKIYLENNEVVGWDKRG